MSLKRRSVGVALNMRVKFEPNRLSEEALFNAYELALSPITEPIQQKRKRQRAIDFEVKMEVSNG